MTDISATPQSPLSRKEGREESVLEAWREGKREARGSEGREDNMQRKVGRVRKLEALKTNFTNYTTLPEPIQSTTQTSN